MEGGLATDLSNELPALKAEGNRLPLITGITSLAG